MKKGIMKERTCDGMKKRRFFSCVLFIALALTLAPCSLAVEVVQTENDKEIYVADYMEFYNNQSGYYSLAKEGYRIIIDVPEEYENLEEARIAELAGDTQKEILTPSVARGTSWPTKTHDVVKDGMYYFEGSTSSYPLYTNYAFVGDYGYVAGFHNRSSTYYLTYRDIYSTPGSLFNPGEVEYGAYKSIGLNQTVIEYFTTNSTTQRLFFEFLDPCTFNGSIAQFD
nr:hypothetical protein [uncultured Dysosmobacter sp.]